MLIDTHCHLNHPAYDVDGEEVGARALEAGVQAMVVIGYDLPSSERAVELAEASPHFWATVGIHPHEAEAADPETLRRIGELARSPRVVAVGEIGFDFYRNLAPRAAQEGAFRAQLELALAAGVPAVIHTRESMAETLEVLFEYREAGLRAVLHCWSGGAAQAAQVTESGWWLGIGGVVTFKNAPELHAVVASSPATSLLLETDAPYLAPQPRRGRRNEPAFLPWIAQRLAELRGVPVVEVAAQTTANALAAFPRIVL